MKYLYFKKIYVTKVIRIISTASFVQKDELCGLVSDFHINELAAIVPKKHHEIIREEKKILCFF